jgi:hypothetical protein
MTDIETTMITREQFDEALVSVLKGAHPDDDVGRSVERALVTLEYETRKPLLPRNHAVTVELLSTGRSIDTAVERVDEALHTLCQFHVDSCPNGILASEEEQGLREFMEKIETGWRDDPDRCAVWTRHLAVLKAGNLLCIPQVTWYLTRTEPQLCVVKDAPVTIAPGEPSCRRELRLFFLRTDRPRTRPLEILVLIGGEQERPTLPRRFVIKGGKKQYRKLFSEDMRKRLYLPDAGGQRHPKWSQREHHCAQIFLYLLQKELVSLDEDTEVKDFLWAYVGKFHHVEEVGVGFVIHELMKRYSTPQDYRAFVKFIRKTIYGLWVTQFSKEYPDHQLAALGSPREMAHRPGESTVCETAHQLGISQRTLYDRIQKGRLPVVRREKQLRISSEEQEVLRKRQEEREQRLASSHFFAYALYAKKLGGISPVPKFKIGKNTREYKSAMRQIRRWRRQGYGEGEIIGKIGPEWLKRVRRFFSQSA